jgi:Carboxypeptidase regulatory-like domain
MGVLFFPAGSGVQGAFAHALPASAESSRFKHFGGRTVKENRKSFLALKNLPRAACLFCAALLVALCLPLAGRAQDTGYISGTVTDKTGAVVAGANVVVSLEGGNLTRTTETNADGAYVVAALPGGTYNITVTATGFQKYQAKGVVLTVAQKARVDVTLTIGAVTEEVVVTGENVAQVETQSSDLSGTITGRQISELQLNGRVFTQLATIVPGVSNQSGQDEGTVGVYGNVAYSFNGGRTEYNNWELDGGDNMDNGSNATLNVYPSIDAIAEFKVLTSNYGAQYGRNASGTVEVETKSGTNSFHGDVYYFGRNDFFNARNFFDPTTDSSGNQLGAPTFKKHDFGYTIGGPVFIPNHYNTDKKKTFFFFSEEWRRDLVPGQAFLVGVPSMAERGGDFTDVCPNPNVPAGTDPMIDCPIDPRTGAKFDGSQGPLPVDPNAKALLAMFPAPNAPGSLCGQGIVACFNSSPAEQTKWREELVRIDHNFSSNERLTFRYIHDSWNTVTATTLWSCPDGCSYPTIQTNFVGPGTSTVARLTSTLSPTLLNEFVASYTGDHIFLTNIGPGAAPRPSSMTMTGLFPYSGTNLPGISINGNSTAYGGNLEEDAGFIPWDNANPTYTLRDNMTKVIGTHTLQFGAYAAIAQKNEQSSYGDRQGFLTFNASNTNVSTGNAFADLLLGRIDTFEQVNTAPKYYFRYQIVEPYFQDDWRVTPRLTLNLGLRVSLFGTYHEKYNQTFNFEPSAFNSASAPFIDDGSVTGTEGALLDLPPSNPAAQPLSTIDPRVFNGIQQCGGTGIPRGCVKGHLFNPAPRIGFAWDPWGNGKWAIRGGYGIFFEHGNGNEQNVEALEATAPLVLNPSQPNIIGYTNIGGGGGTVLAFPLGFNAISTSPGWPYMQQWNLNVQHELPQHFVTSIAYVGSKGTHLGRRLDLNQVVPLPLSQNPYQPGEAIGPNDCNTATTPSGTPVTGQALVNLGIACGNDPNPNRPFVGFGSINFMQFAANSNYNALQVSVRRAIAPLTLSIAYTYSHSIDNASDGGAFNAPSFVDSYNIQRSRASSDFDQRHMLNISYVYDLPFMRHASGIGHALLADWHYSGLVAIQTGVPFSVVFSGFSDNAGVSNGSGPGTYADRVGNPNSGIPASSGGPGPLLFNPNAFAAPRGLTFGDAGRNLLHMPRTTNFDMSLLKNFKINESTGFQFRAEAFNIFNHTQWSGSSSAGAGINNDIAGSDFLHPSSARRARTLQFGLKFLF